jgi:hypothetical protein
MRYARMKKLKIKFAQGASYAPFDWLGAAVAAHPASLFISFGGPIRLTIIGA